MAGPFLYYCGHHIGDWSKRSVITVYKGQNLSGEELNKIHSATFSGLTGPFKTKRAAIWYRDNPGANGSITDFERIAKEEENKVKQDRKSSLNKTKEHTFMNGFTRKFDELTAWRFAKSHFDTMVKKEWIVRCVKRFRIKGLCDLTSYLVLNRFISSEIELEMDTKVEAYNQAGAYKWDLSVDGHKQRAKFCQRMIDKILQSKKD